MKLFLRAFLRAFRPLRQIADELRMLRRLAEIVAATHLNVILPDERLLAKTPKADRVEISYGVGKQKQDDGVEQQEEGVIEPEFEDWTK